MSEPAILALALLAGGALGIFFFGGLWWTVRRGLSSEIPALWFVGSFALRTGVILLGFYLISQGHWDRALACAAGFMIGRFGVTGMTRRAALLGVITVKGPDHAP